MIPITTPTGKQTDLLKPDLRIEDVAIALAGLARYDGAACWYNKRKDPSVVVGHRSAIAYTRNCRLNVAQHSCMIYDWLKEQGADRETLRYALLHDAAEAAYGDKTKPVQEMESEVLADCLETAKLKGRSANAVLFDKYHDIHWLVIQALQGVLLPKGATIIAVHEADTRIVADEYASQGWDWPESKPKPEPLGVTYEPWDMIRSEDEYMVRAKEVGLV